MADESSRSFAWFSSFSANQLIQARAPVDLTLSAFRNEICRDKDDWTSPASQASFANLIRKQWDNPYGPSRRYLHKLVRNFVQLLEEVEESENAGVSLLQDDDLAELVMKSSQACPPGIPRPDESCYQSFDIPRKGAAVGKNGTRHSSNGKDGDTWEQCVATTSDLHCQLLRIRVFPMHNDVGLKLWEAGSCLAEFMLSKPHLVEGKHIVEWGAGVGHAGLVVAACCRPASVLVTDYTQASLDNLQHNIDLNREWLGWMQQRQESTCIEGHCGPVVIPTVSDLDWGTYASHEADTTRTTRTSKVGESMTRHLHPTLQQMQRAEVLMAADVVYNANMNPSLSRGIRRFLSERSDCNRTVILASTLRKKVTYTAFLEMLLGKEDDISCTPYDCGDDGYGFNLPKVFPVYHIQPRKDVRICILEMINR